MKNNCGSLQNHLMTNGTNNVTPQVGMGVTQVMYTDRHPFTVIGIDGPRQIRVQEDNAVRTDKFGMSDVQDYTYNPNPEAPVTVLVLKTSKKKPDGVWVRKGESINSSRFMLGFREEYHDYSF